MRGSSNSHHLRIAVTIFLLVPGLSGLLLAASSTNIDSLQQALEHAVTHDEKLALHNSLAYAYMYTDRDRAIAYLDKGRRLISSVSDRHQVAVYHNIWGRYYLTRAAFDSASQMFSDALTIYQALEIPEKMALTHMLLGYCFHVAGNPDSARQHYLAALPLYTDLSDHRGIAQTASNLGHLYNIQGDFDTAMDYFTQALLAFHLLEDSAAIGATFFNMAPVFRNKGDFDRSFELALQALDIMHKRKDSVFLGKIYNEVGNIYYSQLKNYPKALEYYRQSLDLKTRYDDEYLYNAMNNIGYCYLELNDLEAAERYFNKGLDISNRQANLTGKANAKGGLGKLFARQGKYRRALTFFEHSLTHLEQLGDQMGKARVLAEMGSVWISLEAHQKALTHLLKALTIARDIDAPGLLKDIYQQLEICYAAIDDHAHAHHYLKLYMAVSDSFFNIEKVTQIQDLEARYQHDQKMKEIRILTSEKQLQALKMKNQHTLYYTTLGGGTLCLLLFLAIFSRHQTKRRAATLQKMTKLEQQALQSQMNPHFIFNCMNAFQSLILEHKNELAMDYLSKFGSLLRLVLENSTRSYIDLATELKTIKLYLELEHMRIEDKLSFAIHLDDKLQPEEILISPMLIQPFVENAIWHGIIPKKAPGKIELFVQQNGEGIKCIIKDDGIGRIRSRNLNAKKHRSFGMQITEERLKILNQHKRLKEVRVSDLYDQQQQACGTAVEIILPYKKA